MDYKDKNKNKMFMSGTGNAYFDIGDIDKLITELKKIEKLCLAGLYEEKKIGNEVVTSIIDLIKNNIWLESLFLTIKKINEEMENYIGEKKLIFPNEEKFFNESSVKIKGKKTPI